MKISISEIENSDNRSLNISFSEIISEFNNEIPVKADLSVETFEKLVRIKGKIRAEVNLVCDICLKDFTKIFDFNVDEIYMRDSLNSNNQLDFELKDECFAEDLNGKDEIDITDFVYQCVILNIPNKLVCDINCSGDENIKKYVKTEISDPRLEIFKKIRVEKDK